MTSLNINVQQVEAFIKNELPKNLQADLKNILMVKEADLECCAYFHLRTFLETDRTWKVFARKYALRTGHFIDLLLFRKGSPRISIELKWNRHKITKKDLQSLRRSVKKLHVNKAYFIATVNGPREPKHKHKSGWMKRTLVESFVLLDLREPELKEWKKEKGRYQGAKMRVGKKQ